MFAFSFSLLPIALILFQILSSSLAAHVNNIEHQNEYDFIICGGGTAGLLLANRLTESGNFTVLVLEAGPEPFVVAAYETPGGNQFLKGSPIEWGFTTEPQQFLNGRILQYLRGRGLGGSSIINGLFYGRGSASIYDKWVEMGNPGWSWEEVYPLFIKSTHFNEPEDTPTNAQFNQSYKTFTASSYGDGPLQIGFQGYVPDSAVAFIRAASEAAHIPIVEDLNTGNGVGIKQGTGNLDSQIRRSSSYDSFYKQAQNRSNLDVLYYASVTKIVTENGTETLAVTGVEFINQRSSLVHFVKARKEVILSMGAFHTPQLLMISGIGPSAELEKFAIEPVLVNENIGQHLNDHNVFSIMATVRDEASTTKMSATINSLQEAQTLYYDNLTGPYTAPSGITNGFQELPNEELESIGAGEIIEQGLVNRSHIEYLYESVWYPWIPTPYHTPGGNNSYMSLTASGLVALSRGSVTLRSGSMTDPPLINPNYYSNPTDRVMAIQAFKYLRKILNHGDLSQFLVGQGEVSPGPAVRDDDDDAIFEYIKANTFPNWHASGTVQMKPLEDGGVVDPRLRVYGMKGLRVVDCSIIPLLPDVNIVGSVYMIAEKGAQMIRDDNMVM